MEEDQIMEEPQPPHKKSKTLYEDVHLCFANVTTFGRKVQDWVWSKGDHLLFLQETHLSEKKLQETLEYFVARGWKTLGVPATDTGRGGKLGVPLSTPTTPSCTRTAALHQRWKRLGGR